MTYAVTINRSGQATIPKVVREELKVGVGDKIRFVKTKEGIMLKKDMTDEELLAKIDALKSKKTKSLIKKHQGKSVSELQDSPEYRQGYEEEYK